MIKNLKIKNNQKLKMLKMILSLIIGFLLLMLGIILMVIYQNRNDFSNKVQQNLIFIHQKIALDYILIIIGALIISIPIIFKTITSGYCQTKASLKNNIKIKDCIIEDNDYEITGK